jgi:general secretion pathway protein G
MVTQRRWGHAHGGWTLVELTIVISLIVVLSTIALVGYRNAIIRSREAVLKEDLFRMRDAIDQFYADKEGYPSTLETLVAEGYLRAIPLDPFTSSAETWQPIFAELDPADPMAQGVFDVKTTHEGMGLDGTAYAGW